MNETMLVRAAGGGWEELRPQTSMPEGGIVEVFGDDIGPVLGVTESVLVAACEPTLSMGTPDAICVDATGGIWIVQLALDGDGAATLPQLLAFGGSLTGMDYASFEAVCDRRGTGSLGAFVKSSTNVSGFTVPAFEKTVAESLAHGRFRLVAIVREAAPSLVQSMRFLNASGAMGALYEASSFASDSVSAVRARAIDLGAPFSAAPRVAAAAPAGQAAEPAVAAAPAPAAAPAATVDAGLAAFLVDTATATDVATSALMSQLYDACTATFADVHVDGTGDDASMSVVLRTEDTEMPLLVAATDGSVVVSFEALGAFDTNWSIRAELCQGMERLLGADLGDVRKISQLNLSIAEHLMDATLMEALIELLAETAQSIDDGNDGARIGAREPAAA
ncbi:MAG: hypothetical protein JWM90_82 [Thermoleophilia bacterium]|nr:hypothetical protein [Thermoleophilia bacterium]